jgi:hypothetical protein
MGILNISQPCGPPHPVTDITLLLFNITSGIAGRVRKVDEAWFKI